MAERSRHPGPEQGPELRPGAGPEPEPVSVPIAASALGISERAVRKRIAAGTLRAEPFGRSYRVWLPEDAPPPGPEPGPAAGPDPGPEHRPEQGPEPIEAQFHARAVTVSPAGYAQLEAIRDQWLAPLVAQITEQAERIGRLEAERDAADREIAELGERLDLAASALEQARERVEAAEREREELRRLADDLQARHDGLRSAAVSSGPPAAPAGTSEAEDAGDVSETLSHSGGASGGRSGASKPASQSPAARLRGRAAARAAAARISCRLLTSTRK